MRIGLVARCDNSGLGTMSWEIYRHLPISKVVLISNGVYKTFPERFGGGIEPIQAAQFDNGVVQAFLEDLDVVLAVETPYNWNLFAIARKMGVKTVLFPMYECLKKEAPTPDLYLCNSLLDYDEVTGNKVFLPFPTNPGAIKHNLRRRADVFVHNAGHGGLMGRNGTDILLKAIPLVKSKVHFIIRSQRPIACADPRVEVRVGNFENYFDMWDEGDVFVFPHKFDGLSLPIQEALTAGMPLLTTAMYPFTKWLPPEFLIEPAFEEQIILSREIKASFISHETLAEAITALAHQDITALSHQARAIAVDMSWGRLLGEYEKVLKNL